VKLLRDKQRRPSQNSNHEEETTQDYQQSSANVTGCALVASGAVGTCALAKDRGPFSAADFNIMLETNGGFFPWSPNA
jgi:hypothetical protein